MRLKRVLPCLTGLILQQACVWGRPFKQVLMLYQAFLPGPATRPKPWGRLLCLEPLEARLALSGTDLWEVVPGRRVSDLDFGAGGQAYFLGSESVPGGHPILRRDSANGDLSQIPGGAVSVAVDPQGVPWVVNSAGNIFRWNVGRNDWDVLPGRARQIDIGANGAVWTLGWNSTAGGYDIFRYDAGRNDWVSVPGGATAITVDPVGNAWVVNSNGDTFRDRPGVYISNVSVREGDAGVTSAELTLSLSRPAGERVAVNWRTLDGTARAGSDYDAASGTVVFEPGQTSKTITVGIRGDRTFEADETFGVALTAVNAVAAQTGTVTILNDDPNPIRNLLGAWAGRFEALLRSSAPRTHKDGERGTRKSARSSTTTPCGTP